MNGCVEIICTEELVLDISFKRLLWIWFQFPSSPTNFLFIAKLKKKTEKIKKEIKIISKQTNKQKDKEAEEKETLLKHTEICLSRGSF